MVPVAIDYAKVLDTSTPEGEFLLPLLRQREQTQGFWVFSPDGKCLAAHESSVPVHNYQLNPGPGRSVSILEESLAEVEKALLAFGNRQVRQTKQGKMPTNRGVGTATNGTVILAQYVRRRDQSNISSPVIDSVALTSGELESLIAPTVNRSDTSLPTDFAWQVPCETLSKFYRILSPIGFEDAPKQDWLTNSSLSCSAIDDVVEIQCKTDDGLKRFQLRGVLEGQQEGGMAGRIRTQHRVELHGRLVYDTTNQQVESVVLVGEGTARWIQEAPDQPVQFDTLVEWRRR